MFFGSLRRFCHLDFSYTRQLIFIFVLLVFFIHQVTLFVSDYKRLGWNQTVRLSAHVVSLQTSSDRMSLNLGGKKHPFRASGKINDLFLDDMQTMLRSNKRVNKWNGASGWKVGHWEAFCLCEYSYSWDKWCWVSEAHRFQTPDNFCFSFLSACLHRPKL